MNDFTKIDNVKIGNIIVGNNNPVFIIAEAGVNHNGDINQAKKLIRQAKKIGANCIKFQTFKAERVVTQQAPKANYQLKTTNPQESQLDMLRKLELSPIAYQELVALCQKEDILIFSTPYNREDVDFLDELGVPAFKLASIHLVEPYFLQYVAAKNKPMIISTGMATLAEVDEAIRAIKSTGNTQIIVLQCTTNYPSKLEDANLKAMQTMQNAFNVLVGYSDHTQSNTACIASVAMGACVIEKHFTLDKSLAGPDHSSSADPAEFEMLIKDIREAEMVLGSAIKEPCEVEKINAVGMRRSIVAKCDILAGDTITEDMLTFKRPASGIKPAFFADIVGRIAQQTLNKNELVTWEALGGYATGENN